MHSMDAERRDTLLQAFIDFKVKHPRLQEIDDTLTAAMCGHRIYNTGERWARIAVDWDVVGGEKA